MTSVRPYRTQLLKWVGNKQRFAHEIVSYFPAEYGTYYEPFLGSGGVLATLAPRRAVGSDAFGPLLEIWRTLQESPETRGIPVLALTIVTDPEILNALVLLGGGPSEVLSYKAQGESADWWRSWMVSRQRPSWSAEQIRRPVRLEESAI